MARKNLNAVRGTGRRHRIVLHPRRCGCRSCRTKRLIHNGTLPAPPKGTRVIDPGWKVRVR